MNYIKVLISTILTLWSANSFAASQGGGLPQMDIGSYPSQIFLANYNFWSSLCIHVEDCYTTIKDNSRRAKR